MFTRVYTKRWEFGVGRKDIFFIIVTIIILFVIVDAKAKYYYVLLIIIHRAIHLSVWTPVAHSEFF